MDNIVINMCSISNDKKDIGKYQLGDHILGRNDKGEYDSDHYLITDKRYKNTILGNYALEILKNNNNDRINIIANIIRNMIKNNKYDLPKENDIVIHIRLGDVFDLPESDVSLEEKKPNLEKILKTIKNNKQKNKLIFVAAMSFGPGKFSEKKRIEKGSKLSKDFMQKIIKNIPSDMPYEIRSNDNVDHDFIYMVNAKNLVITSKSGFSTVALLVKKKLI